VGDDLFIHKLVSSYPDIRFVLMVSRPYREMFARYRNVTVYEEEGFLLRAGKKLRIDDRIRWRISHECDYAVLIGGSIFQEYPEWENQHQWYRELFNNDRLYFLGCSWGVCRTKRYEEEMRGVFSGVRDICFRDRRSYSTFSELPNVRYAPDILFGFDWSPYAQIREKKQVLISTVNCRSENIGLDAHEARYHQFLGSLTEDFVARGYRVVFCAFWEGDGDLAAARMIQAALPPRVQAQTSVVSYCGTNMEQILELIAESEYMVATRFHAMVLGLGAGKKVLPLIYHIKLRNVLEDLSFRSPYYDIRQLPADTTGVIEQIGRGITDLERDALARSSAAHFDAFNQRENHTR
jgi:colanic acid/amylovoran biosynthesis protein